MCSRIAALVLVLVLVLVAGCTPELCGRSSDCASGLVCTTIGTCAIAVDAAVGDATAMEIDAGVTAIHDADGDAQGIEPIDAAAADAAPAADANTIDAPSDDGLTSAFPGVW